MVQGNTKKLFTRLFTAAFLVSTLMVPMPARASVPAGEDKIEKALLNELKPGKSADVIVKMKQASNLERALLQRKDLLGRKLSPIEQRKTVISELQVTAAESQAGLLSLVKAKKSAGAVESYQSFYIINAVQVKADAQVIKELAELPSVEKIYKNSIVPLEEPLNPSAGTKSNPAELEWNIKKVQADKVWDEFGIDGSGVLVGVIDSGINAMHPALRTKFKAWDPSTQSFDPALLPESFKDFTGNETTPYDDPMVPHGSHVSGIIAGSEADGTNQIGVAPGAQLIVGKALTAMGGSDAGLLGAAEWMLAPGGKAENAPRIVNNSWGGGANTDEWFNEVIDTWRKAGILPVFAAGNQRPGEPSPWPGSLSNPANVPGSFAVAATDANNQRGSFSYIGPSLFDPTGKVIKPDVAAPGVSIRSSVLGEDYMSMDGTSMAAPHVAGVAALILQANPSLTVEEVEAILRKTAVPLKDRQFPTAPNMGYGHGNINAYDAVAEALGIGTGKITGSILTGGTDLTPPKMTINYPKELYANQPIPVSLTLQDDVGITKTSLKIRKAGSAQWDSVELERTSGTDKHGDYQALLEGSQATYPYVDLLVEINDFGNHFDSQILRLDLKLGILPGSYFNDFEHSTTGWKLENTWKIGQPKDSLEPSPYSGKQVLGTNVGENSAEPHPGRTPVPAPPPSEEGGVKDPGMEYPKGDFIAYVPPMDLRTATAEQAVLSFAYVFKNNPATAQAVVEVSKDGKNWSTVKSLEKTTTGWKQTQVDLSDFCGFEKALTVRFRINLDGSSMATGLYLDDVRLGKETKVNATATLSASATVQDDGMNQATVAFPDHTLPIQGTLRVLETDRIVDNDSLGSFTMRHAVEKSSSKWTLEASAYGYKTERRSITFGPNETIEENFILVPLQRDDIKIKVTNRLTGEPIPEAQIRLTDDSNYKPALSSESGEGTLTDVYEGAHTLRVFAPGYDVSESRIQVFADDNDIIQIRLNPYQGQEKILNYGDPGLETWWRGLAFLDPGIGFVMRFTAEERGKVSAVEMAFTDRHPVAKGSEIGILVLVKNEKGNFVPAAEPFVASVEIGHYNRISLEALDVYVEKGEDFYLGTYQVHPQKDSPALVFKPTYDDPTPTRRSYAWVGDLIPFEDPALELWDLAPAIKAVMTEGDRLPSPLETPVLTNRDYLTYTKDNVIDLKGTAPAGSTVTILDQETVVDQIRATDGSFTWRATLNKPTTKLRFRSEMADRQSYLSMPYSLVLDQTEPVVEIETPQDAITVQSSQITLRGTARDEHIESIQVNGKRIALAGETFEQTLKLQEGDNEIAICAMDQAGNKTLRKVAIRYDRPTETDPHLEIREMKPQSDVSLKPGEATVLSFSGTPGMNAFFQLTAPMGLSAQRDLRVPMQEVASGQYEATYTVPDNLSGTFQVNFHLAVEGYETGATAQGRLIIDGSLSPRLTRIFGLNRYATAVEISKQAFDTSKVVLLTESEILADSVLAGPLSVAMNAPVLLTGKNDIPKETLAEINRLKAENVLILGGKLAISEEVETALAKDFKVERLAGATRFDTSVLVARKIHELTGNDSFFVTNGHAFADSLVVGAVSGNAGQGTTPILFAQKDEVPVQIRNYLNTGTWKKTWVIGGSSVLSEQVMSALKQYQPTRLAGATRYATAAVIARQFTPNLTRLALAEGSRGLDALTSAVYLANHTMPVLLTQKSEIPQPVKDCLSADLFEVLILGGPSAIAEEAEAQIKLLLSKN
ncbi:S8 family serine peptidase [Proteiniclasticum sp. QWL-01]|uniref:S8 family serine peptidase n=1 Tax=Proteiniclasticum sp. QWL-01 TaxID=3036945 RepID=UPI002410DD1E|nr:S8 family serine peptidase [Proteiniclasticum sp. QWL-01]WFF73199.1 S8 family serine peptidase [Proteiniclasticum sp. QWL-01]